jgi:hypothetical protein
LKAKAVYTPHPNAPSCFNIRTRQKRPIQKEKFNLGRNHILLNCWRLDVNVGVPVRHGRTDEKTRQMLRAGLIGANSKKKHRPAHLR